MWLDVWLDLDLRCKVDIDRCWRMNICSSKLAGVIDFNSTNITKIKNIYFYKRQFNSFSNTRQSFYEGLKFPIQNFTPLASKMGFSTFIVAQISHRYSEMKNMLGYNDYNWNWDLRRWSSGFMAAGANSLIYIPRTVAGSTPALGILLFCFTFGGFLFGF